MRNLLWSRGASTSDVVSYRLRYFMYLTTKHAHFIPVVVVVWLFFSYQLIRYIPSRGYKINGTKPNQSGKRSQKETDKKVARKGHCRQEGNMKRQIKQNECKYGGHWCG